MSEVSVRLSELHNASENLRQSAYRLQLAVDNVIPLIDQSLLDALPNSENVVLYQSHKAKIAGFPAQVRQFADNLDQAADDIEYAVDGQKAGVVVHFYAPKRAKFGKHSDASLLTSSYMNSADSPSHIKMTIDDYVSGRNQALYNELKATQSHLDDRTTAMTLLINQRNVVAEDLSALKNRMLSYDPTTEVDLNPRMLTLQTQLDNLDSQIETLQTEVDNLQVDVQQMTERLDRVAPAVGAEVDAIIGLEDAENPTWMKNSTFGCVNHVVNKMPLPNGVPRDALLWDDAALQLPQYGISWGDTPLEGAVLQLDPSHPYADDQYGHVLYVERVENGVVWVTDNIHPDDPIRLDTIMSKLEGEDMRYMYFPWHTRA